MLKGWSTAHKGLKYKLMLAFSLMSVIPLLACVYIISNNLFPALEELFTVSVIILAAILIALLGLLLAKALVDPVIDMAIEAKVIASGEYDKRISVSTDDEVGNIASSINAMTHKIKTNLDELKNYGQRMREINVDIHKKVLALSSLLQIGDIISGGSIQIDSLLELAVERVSAVVDGGFAALYMPMREGEDLSLKTSYGITSDRLSDLIVRQEGNGLLEKSLSDHSLIIADKSVKHSREMADLLLMLDIANMLGIPIYTGKRTLGMLVVGSKLVDMKFKNDDIELIKVFAKQITIAIESDILNKKTEALAIKDDLTGLYNKNFILGRLEEEIKRAIFYQRPCSLIVFNVDGFKSFRDKHGELVSEEVLKKISKILKDSLDPIGKAARIGGDEFAMLLPEKNKRESANIADDVRARVSSTNLLREGQVMLTVSAGVSENPLDGSTGDELFRKAMESLRQAKSSGPDKVVA